jgi:hypothetical protein
MIAPPAIDNDLPGTLEALSVPGNPNFRSLGTKTPHFVPGNRFLDAAAGAWAVLKAVDVCLRRRGPWGGCVGAAAAKG